MGLQLDPSVLREMQMKINYRLGAVPGIEAAQRAKGAARGAMRRDQRPDPPMQHRVIRNQVEMEHRFNVRAEQRAMWAPPSFGGGWGDLGGRYY
mmetsp:Transcript_9722/g.15232  ORF Transcript_9722/g.15232 Transcript_9722/m.15232 type:complete len:94 (+) Transcript_9722:784-1065(+)